MKRDQSFPSETVAGVRSGISRAILALAPVLVTFLVQLLAWPIIRPFAWFLFTPAVFFSAWVGGRRLGILASVVATLLVWFFFLPPEGSFFVEDVRALVSASTFLGTGVIFSLFHDRLKRAERRAAEGLAARQYQAQLESVFQAIRDGIVVTDMNGTFLLVNEAEARMTGFPSAESMKRDITFFQRLYELSYPDGKSLPLEQWPINRVLKGESITNLELRARRRDNGQEAFFSFSGEPVRDQQGKQILAVVGTRDISERKRAEDKLRASEEQFRVLADSAPVLMWISGTDKLCTFFNKPWLEFTGRKMEQELGSGWTEGIHPDDYDRCLETYDTSFKAREAFEMEYRLRRHDSEYRWILDHAVPRFSPDGDFLGYIGSCIDITERKDMEEALRESESRFRQLAESLPQLVWTTRADGPCDYLSPQWVAYTGVPEADQLGFGWLQQLHPDDRDPTVAAWNQAVSNDAAFDLEFRIRRHDGAYRWFKTRAVALRDSGGRITRWFGSNTDIEDQIHAEQSLRESKDQLAGIVSSAMDAIIAVDEGRHIVLFNEAAEKMFDCPAAEAIGHPLDSFIPESSHRAHSGYIYGFGETGGTSSAIGRPVSALRSDGSQFPIEASISFVKVAGRRLYTVILRDITERKQAEREREQLAQEQVARAAAETANRSKDEFLAMVSHELRSPLNAILGYTRLLRSGPAEGTEINKCTSVIERNAKAQLQIIEDLLDSARIIRGKLRIELAPVDLVPVLQASLDTVRPTAEAKGITLVANFLAAPEQTLGDSTRLQQIVWNLLANAVKFTLSGGRVELRMESEADHTRITVSDTGKGIAPEFLPFIFDRFRQADPSSTRRVGGLGLGLSLVKHLVELHGGTITAASEGLGRGAIFTVMLPRRQPEFIEPIPAVLQGEVRTVGAMALEEAPSLEGKFVLAVDDQEEARVALTQTLGQYGAQVTAVPSGAEALALLANPPGGRRPDVLILDIAMPGEDGYAVLKKERALEAEWGAEKSQIPAIALTAYGRSEDRLRALQAGFQMHVAKPVEPVELAVVITSLTSEHPWDRGWKKFRKIH